jgi:hypothetical protein
MMGVERGNEMEKQNRGGTNFSPLHALWDKQHGLATTDRGRRIGQEVKHELIVSSTPSIIIPRPWSEMMAITPRRRKHVCRSREGIWRETVGTVPPSTVVALCCSADAWGAHSKPSRCH